MCRSVAVVVIMTVGGFAQGETADPNVLYHEQQVIVRFDDSYPVVECRRILLQHQCKPTEQGLSGRNQTR